MVVKIMNDENVPCDASPAVEKFSIFLDINGATCGVKITLATSNETFFIHMYNFSPMWYS